MIKRTKQMGVNRLNSVQKGHSRRGLLNLLQAITFWETVYPYKNQSCCDENLDHEHGSFSFGLKWSFVFSLAIFVLFLIKH